jgi:hypothetical protein
MTETWASSVGFFTWTDCRASPERVHRLPMHGTRRPCVENGPLFFFQNSETGVKTQGKMGIRDRVQSGSSSRPPGRRSAGAGDEARTIPARKTARLFLTLRDHNTYATPRPCTRLSNRRSPSARPPLTTFHSSRRPLSNRRLAPRAYSPVPPFVSSLSPASINCLSPLVASSR